MDVDVASPAGGMVAVDPKSFRPVIRTAEDDRFLADDEFRAKVTDSLAIGDLDMSDYDIVFLAGGWGAAFDFGFSEALGEKMTEANAAGKVMGGVCHGPLGLLNAKAADGSPLVAGRRISAVTDKQVHELGIDATPHHPETRAARCGRAVRERDQVPRSAGQPLGGRRQPRHRPEPERRADGGPGDDADPRGSDRRKRTTDMSEQNDLQQQRTGGEPRYGTIDRAYGMTLATTPADDDGPVWMVNLMKYREVADYADGRQSSISGQEADDVYSPLDSLAAVGATPVFFGDVDQQLLGDGTVWDRVGIVKYPTRKVVHRHAIAPELSGVAPSQRGRHGADDRDGHPADGDAAGSGGIRAGRLGRRSPSAHCR